VSFTFDPGSTDTPYKDRQQDPAQITCEGHRTVLTRACGLSNFVVLIAFLNGSCGNATNLPYTGRPYEHDIDRRRSQDRQAKTRLVRVSALQSTQKFCSDMKTIVATRPDNDQARKRQPTTQLIRCSTPTSLRLEAPFRLVKAPGPLATRRW